MNLCVVKTEEVRTIRIIIADDHSIFREGLRTLLDACSDMQVIGEAENGQQALSLVQNLNPDVAVIDINMPVMNGIEATRLIKERVPRVYVIGLSMHSEQVVKDSFISAGGDQFVSKGGSLSTFPEIIRASGPGSISEE